MEDAATPFPREETTPPVTKIYFAAIRKFLELPPLSVIGNGPAARNSTGSEASSQDADVRPSRGGHGRDSPAAERRSVTRATSSGTSTAMES